MLIMQDALPLFKSFLKPVSLKQHARQLVLRCVIAFLMHLGKMSASRVAAYPNRCEASRSSQSIPGRRYWRRCDLLGQLRAQLLEMEARQGTSSSTSIKPTVASKLHFPRKPIGEQAPADEISPPHLRGRKLSQPGSVR